ncbi:MAG TPA: STAS domain-containing protein [Gemmataceae bacterium]|nr:STAS domain-containing protein [Gemmataceae bacterium]
MTLFLTQGTHPRTSPGAMPRLETRQRHVTGWTEHDVAVVTVTTPQLLEDVVADGLEQELLACVAQREPCDVVLDLQVVNAVSNAAIQAIVQLHDFVQERGRRLVVSGVCPCVAEAIHLARQVEAESTLELFLPMQADVPSAIAWLSGST